MQPTSTVHALNLTPAFSGVFRISSTGKPKAWEREYWAPRVEPWKIFPIGTMLIFFPRGEAMAQWPLP